MDEQTLLIVFLGFLVIFATVTIMKTIRSYYVFKASFYTEIYSGFFEFLVRKGNLKRMSKSYWLENELGDHRIMFQVTTTKQKDIFQPYLLILLTTGLYIIQIHNKTSHYIYDKNKFKSVDEKQNVHYLPNPISEITEFQKHFLERIEKTSFPIYPFIALTNESQLENNEKKIIFVHKNHLFETLKQEHTSHQEILTKHEIDMIYQEFIQSST